MQTRLQLVTLLVVVYSCRVRGPWPIFGNPVSGGAINDKVHPTAAPGEMPEVTDESGRSNRAGYIGCYKDIPSDRAMSRMVYKARFNSPEFCFYICSVEYDGAYRYIGLQNGDECWCSNWGFGRHGPGEGCNMTCTGASRSICGGLQRISVYPMYFGDGRSKTTERARVTTVRARGTTEGNTNKPELDVYTTTEQIGTTITSTDPISAKATSTLPATQATQATQTTGKTPDVYNIGTIFAGIIGAVTILGLLIVASIVCARRIRSPGHTEYTKTPLYTHCAAMSDNLGVLESNYD